MLVSTSFASGLDFRDYLTMMGILYSQKAREQVESFGYEVVPNKYFISTDKEYCSSDAYGMLFDRNMLNVDGTAVFPY